MKILVVGAGFYGTTIARKLAEAGHDIVVIDKRDHIAGNAYDYVNVDDVRIHKYGPHLFHTNNKEVVEYLGMFTDWVSYYHKVKAILSDGRYVTLPVNKETKEIVGADKIVETFIRPYSEKMWNMKLEELDPNIMNRVPIRDDDNELYFPKDEYQLMPVGGYTEMFKKMLDHPNIEVKLRYSFNIACEAKYDYIFNSMPIDEYFDFEFGELPYRSIKFHTHSLPTPKLLPTAVVNFTHDGPYTRMTEWKNIPLHGDNEKVTWITYEEPCDYKDNYMERYYPVKDISGKNREIYRLYAEKAKLKKNMEFIGRCGLYAYLDMDQAVASALACADRFLEKHK